MTAPFKNKQENRETSSKRIDKEKSTRKKQANKKVPEGYKHD
jgi:hypothetical protein